MHKSLLVSYVVGLVFDTWSFLTGGSPKEFIGSAGDTRELSPPLSEKWKGGSRHVPRSVFLQAACHSSSDGACAVIKRIKQHLFFGNLSTQSSLELHFAPFQETSLFCSGRATSFGWVSIRGRLLNTACNESLQYYYCLYFCNRTSHVHYFDIGV